MDLATNLPYFSDFIAMAIFMDRMTKMLDFGPYTNQVIGPDYFSYLLIRLPTKMHIKENHIL